MLQELRFAIASTPSSDGTQLSPQRLINAYAEIQPKEAGAKSPLAIFGAPGCSTFATLGSGPIRGMCEMNGVGYAVSGGEFYSFNAAGTGTLLGSGITGEAPVSMDSNSNGEIVIVNGSLGFSYLQASNDFTQIQDSDFQTANSVSCINSIFAFDWVGTNKWFISEVLDGRSYDALSFASAESHPDGVRAVRQRNGILFIFGERTIESWDHTGAYNFPFSRFKGGTIGRGLAASRAVASEDEALFFLGDDLVMYRLDGLRPRRISNHALERTWSEYAKTSDAFCFSLSLGGHKFIYLTFPSQGRTFGFDIAANNLWHERMSWDASGGEVKWRANCALNIFNKTLIGDANSGKLGQVGNTIYTEFDDPIRTRLVFPNLHANGREVTMSDFEADMEVGVGLTTGQGSDPKVMLRWSNDGGRTYEPVEEWRSIGAKGEYFTKVSWDRLGRFRQRVMEVSISDPVKRVFHGFRSRLEVENS